jgi:hypothetical protein
MIGGVIIDEGIVGEFRAESDLSDGLLGGYAVNTG